MLPLTLLMNAQSGYQRACSVKGSCACSQLHKLPSQWKHLTTSRSPVKIQLNSYFQAIFFYRQSVIHNRKAPYLELTFGANVYECLHRVILGQTPVSNRIASFHTNSELPKFWVRLNLSDSDYLLGEAESKSSGFVTATAAVLGIPVQNIRSE